MISFVHGSPEQFNASVKFADMNEPIKAHSVRDDDGNIVITVDVELEPENGDSVNIILHAENNGKYNGIVKKTEDGQMIFAG